MAERSSVDLSIVIVNWNSAEYVRACVQSIQAETRNISYEVVVVDNASFDGCQQLLAREYPDVRFLQSDRNLGFGGANNFGAAQSRGRVLLFLNPDTEVRNSAIDRLYGRFADIDDAGVMGCRLLNSDESLQTSCVQALPTVLNQLLDAEALRRCLPRARLWGTRALFGDASVPAEVESISGACMMVRREVFERVGGFSPAFFMYGEDLDLCARIRGAGLRNLYMGSCEIVHHGGGSARNAPSTFSVVMICESVAVLLERLRGPRSSRSYRVALTLAALIRLVILAAASPVWFIVRGTTSWAGAWRKWQAVLGWGLGINRPAFPRAHVCPEATS